MNEPEINGNEENAIVPLRGRFYLDDSCEGGWQVVDRLDGSTLGHGSKRWASGVAQFARAYVRLWGDIDFQSFPYSLDEPFTGRVGTFRQD